MSSYRAVTYQAPQGAEIVGGAIEGFFETLTQDVLDPILERYNITRSNFDPQKWYPLQVMYDITQEGVVNGDYNVETAMGKAVAADIIQMYGLRDLTEFFEKDLNEVAVSAIRNVPVGFGYNVTKLGHQYYHVQINLPSADYTVYGYVWEVMRLLRREGENFQVIPESGFGVGNTPGSFEAKWGLNL